MEVFTEPVRQTEEISLPESLHLKESAEDLAFLYGINVQWIPNQKRILTVSELMIQMAQNLAIKRERTAKSLRASNVFKDIDLTYFNKSVSILGSGLIVEALAKHFSMLEWTVRAISSSENELTDFEPGECFILAGEVLLKNDLLKTIVEQKPAYIGIVDNFQHVQDIINRVGISLTQLQPFPIFVPAGIDIGATNPYEVALSVVAEILLQIRDQQ